MVPTILKLDTFDKDFYNKSFCEYQIKEWKKFLNYNNRKLKIIKSVDLRKHYMENFDRAEKQILIYNLLIENIHKKKNVTQNEEQMVILKIKEIFL